MQSNEILLSEAARAELISDRRHLHAHPEEG